MTVELDAKLLKKQLKKEKKEKKRLAAEAAQAQVQVDDTTPVDDRGKPSFVLIAEFVPKGPACLHVMAPGYMVEPQQQVVRARGEVAVLGSDLRGVLAERVRARCDARRQCPPSIPASSACR